MYLSYTRITVFGLGYSWWIQGGWLSLQAGQVDLMPIAPKRPYLYGHTITSTQYSSVKVRYPLGMGTTLSTTILPIAPNWHDMRGMVQWIRKSKMNRKVLDSVSWVEIGGKLLGTNDSGFFLLFRRPRNAYALIWTVCDISTRISFFINSFSSNKKNYSGKQKSVGGCTINVCSIHIQQVHYIKTSSSDHNIIVN